MRRRERGMRRTPPHLVGGGEAAVSPNILLVSSGTVISAPSSSGVTLIWHPSRELVKRGEEEIVHCIVCVCMYVCVCVCVRVGTKYARVGEPPGEVEHVLLLLLLRRQLVVERLVERHVAGGAGQLPAAGAWGTFVCSCRYVGG